MPFPKTENHVSHPNTVTGKITGKKTRNKAMWD
jgi:hypothetical protein